MQRSQAEDTTSVLLIACAGRSGSTLLDRIIGMNPGFCSVGELRFIWERSFGEDQLCGCGLPFHQCDFWGEVSSQVFGVAASQADVTTAIRLRQSLDEIRYAPWLVQSHRPARYQSALGDYTKLLGCLYEAIAQVSDQRVIVDSSGDPTHGLILSMVRNINLHVVHLVRDPRAVVFSWKRTRRRPEIHWTVEDMPIERIWTSVRRWGLHNTVAELLSRSADSYCRLRYEDFVADPSAALTRVLAPYEWAGSQLKGLEDMEVVLEPTHTVSGNPVRFKQGPLRIRLDDEWRSTMLRRDRRLVTAMTWPLLTRYGYPLRSGA